MIGGVQQSAEKRERKDETTGEKKTLQMAVHNHQNRKGKTFSLGKS